MESLRLEIDKSSIYVFLNSKYFSCAPFLFKRLKPEFWKYYTDYVEFGSKNNVLNLKIDDIKSVFEPYKNIVCDLVDFDINTRKYKQVKVLENFTNISGILKLDYGDLEYFCYKNSNQGLSFNFKYIPNFEFKLVDINVTNNIAYLKINKNCKFEFKLSICRRSSVAHESRYDCCIPLKKYKNIDNRIMVEIPLKGLFDTYIKHGKECWDVVAEIEGYKVTINCTDINTEYNEVNDSFLIKFFTSESKFLSIYTKENSNTKQKKIKVAILGSCFTRESFHSLDYYNPDYKRYYEVVLTGFHQSIIDLMSKKIEYKDEEIFDPKNPKMFKYAKQLLNKSFLKELNELKPDYLIIYPYIEVAGEIVELGNNSFVTKNFYLENTKFIKNTNYIRSYIMFDKERFEFYKNYLRLFIQEVRKIMDDDKIILVRAEPAINKFDGTTMTDWGQEIPFILAQRLLWEKYDNYLINQIPKIKIIDMRNKNYYSAKSYLHFGRNHLNKEYYKDLLNEINKLVLQDKLKGKI